MMYDARCNCMEALILCGGFATRLEPMTLFIPKPLLPIGGKPIIDYIVDDVSRANVSKVTVSVNSKFRDQFEYWKKGKGASYKGEMGMVVEPTVHDGHKFGAIRGVHYAIEKAKIDDDLVIIAGDNFYTTSISNAISQFEKSGRKPTVCVHDVGSLEEARKFGVVELEGHAIKGFEEKPEKPKSSMISTAIYIYPKEMLHKFGDYLNEKNNPDAPGYFLQWLIKNTQVNAVVNHGDWYDIGNLETYKKVYEKFSAAKSV